MSDELLDWLVPRLANVPTSVRQRVLGVIDRLEVRAPAPCALRPFYSFAPYTLHLILPMLQV